MNETAQKISGGRYFRITDFLVVLLCLVGAVIGINLFRNDLNRTIDAQNEKPIGTISIKNNNVQRRFMDRVLWDRLAIESPIYMDDIIRVAEQSTATLHINDTQINLNENTLIRIQPPKTEGGTLEIELAQGGMDLVASPGGSSITLNIGGRKVEVGPGTVLNAAASDDGSIMVQVSEGSAIFIEEDGEARELDAGTMIAFDAEGAEKLDPAAVVRLPRHNARYLKIGQDPLPVFFAWNRVNLDEYEPLRLEIAGNRNYTRDFEVIEAPGNEAQAALGAGLWYWRLLYEDAVLADGQITVADASGPELINPIKDRLISYQTDLPQLRFQWSEVANTTNYILEVSDTPDFENPVLRKQPATASFTDSSLGQGTWYWRVAAVFPSVYEGSASFSQTASFHIEQTYRPVEPVWPEPVVVEEPPQPEPEPVPQPPPPPPPFTAPLNRQPPTGYRIGVAELRTQRSIEFKWSAVQGANAYIFTLYQQNPGGRRQIVRVGPENRTAWTLENISTLERGTFVWQVEAVNMGQGGVIGRRGRTGENTFTLDVPIPAQPSLRIEQIDQTGIPYDD